MEIMNPAEIEKASFAIISEQLGDRQLIPENTSVIKRVIHTTADFDYADNLVFSDTAVRLAKDALRAGAHLVTDTKMALAGISKKALEQLGCTACCFIDTPAVVERARAEGCTRALAAVDMAAEVLADPVIFVVGNAPTALIRLHQLVSEQGLAPALIIAVPVGFVNVVESKEMILKLDVPHIVARGRKGGSNVAAAICNALLYETTDRRL
ncbi:MAG: precorrin-8X methylmutase [Actinomycetia bacterium]|nr:precorrin-8X methylmutase [Actinomycetes bacterium]